MVQPQSSPEANVIVTGRTNDRFYSHTPVVPLMAAESEPLPTSHDIVRILLRPKSPMGPILQHQRAEPISSPVESQTIEFTPEEHSMPQSSMINQHMQYVDSRMQQWRSYQQQQHQQQQQQQQQHQPQQTYGQPMATMAHVILTASSRSEDDSDPQEAAASTIAYQHQPHQMEHSPTMGHYVTGSNENAITHMTPIYYSESDSAHPQQSQNQQPPQQQPSQSHSTGPSQYYVQPDQHYHQFNHQQQPEQPQNQHTGIYPDSTGSNEGNSISISGGGHSAFLIMTDPNEGFVNVDHSHSQ